jgi:YD repeat-containing protein
MYRRAALLLLVTATAAYGQAPVRRLTNIDAIRQFPGYFHLQNVLLRGEFSDDEARLALRANDNEIRVVLEEGVSSSRGMVEVRGHVIDVGRLNQDDPRLGNITQGRERERWPRPGEELFLRVTNVTEAQPPLSPSIRALALEPWKYAGQKLTLVGNFRGRNLFGDLPGAPGKSKYDFVIRGAEGALWVTGLRPRGRGFELDVDRRVDSDRWLEITGTVLHEKGMVLLEGAAVTMAKAPEVQRPPEEPPAPAIAKPPVEVVFSSPTEGDTDVRPTDTVRVQFSRGLDEKSLPGRTRVTILGDETPDGRPHKAVYDGASRSIAISFAEPLARLSTVRVEILDGVKGFDGAPVTPWVLTFSVGG